MKIKDIYLNEENQSRRYCSITKVNEESVKLETKPLKKIADNWVILFAVLAIIIGLLSLNFNIKYFLVSIFLIIFLIFLFIFGNKSILICEKDCLNIKQGFQKLKIPYTNLKNVYIGKVISIPFLFPSRSYNIVVRYEDNFKFLRELEFSLLCADEKELETFINNFIVEKSTEDKYVVYEKRKFWRRFLSHIFTIILFIAILVYVLKYSGININQII